MSAGPHSDALPTASASRFLTISQDFFHSSSHKSYLPIFKSVGANGRLRQERRTALEVQDRTVETGQAPSLHGYWHALNDLPQHLLGLLGFFQGGSVERTHYHAVGENGDNQGLEIFGRAIIVALEEGHGLGGSVEHLRASGRYSEREILGLAGLSDYVQQVRNERFVHVNLGCGLLNFDYIRGVEHGAQDFELGGGGCGPQDFGLRLALGISHAKAHQKTIELRLGQGIRAVW